MVKEQATGLGKYGKVVQSAVEHAELSARVGRCGHLRQVVCKQQRRAEPAAAACRELVCFPQGQNRLPSWPVVQTTECGVTGAGPDRSGLRTGLELSTGGGRYSSLGLTHWHQVGASKRQKTNTQILWVQNGNQRHESASLVSSVSACLHLSRLGRGRRKTGQPKPDRPNRMLSEA